MFSLDYREASDSGSDEHAGPFSEIRPNGKSGFFMEQSRQPRLRSG